MSSVDLYAEDIESCVDKLVGNSNLYFDSMQKGKLTASVTTPSLFLFTLNPIYHASGFLATLVDRILDNYSTYKCIKQENKPEFFEYGLDRFYWEGNPILGRHPTTKDLFGAKSILKEFAFLALGTLFPPFGYGFLADSRDVYKNNSLIAKRVEKAIELGDEVKARLYSDASEEEIREWLKGMAKVGE